MVDVRTVTFPTEESRRDQKCRWENINKMVYREMVEKTTIFNASEGDAVT